MLSLLFASALLVPTQADERRVLVFDLAVDEDDAAKRQEASTVLGLITTTIAERVGRRVLSAEDLREMVSLEQQKEVLECGDEKRCIAELGDAYGAELVFYGRIGAVGGARVLNLSALHTTRAEVVGRASLDLDGAGLVDELRTQVRKMLDDAGVPRPEAEVPVREPAAPLVVVGGVALGVGATFVLAGGTGALVSELALDDPRVAGRDKEGAFSLGIAGLVFVGVGVATALAGGGLMWGAQ